MKEKKFTRWMTKWLLVLLAGFIGSMFLLRTVLGHDLKTQLINLSNAEVYGEKYDSDQIEWEMDKTGLVNVKSVDFEQGGTYITLEPVSGGEGQVFISLIDRKTGTQVDSVIVEVLKNGDLKELTTQDFSHYRESQLCITFFLILLTLFIWKAYLKAEKELQYSYHSIFCYGLGVWLALYSFLMLGQYLSGANMANVYQYLAGAPVYFVLLTFPLILIYAVMMTISNISLIRHEGFRFTNALGILLSFVMIFGFAVIEYFNWQDFSGSQFRSDLRSSVIGVMYCAYAILECFLLGSIVCGLKAAKHKPAYDKDYIVILGCMIRKDGTLYPLIRGRVDRAIQFYKEQLAATGKKAVFIPSGGKGSDEPIAEGEAMKRYLLEQGIEESQILVEDQSVNTRENMLFSHRLMKENTKAVFSTTNFHVFRSGIISRNVEFEADGMGSATKWYFWPNAFVREVIGMLALKWKFMVFLFIPLSAYIVTLYMYF